MNAIVATIKAGDSGANVANLIQGLLVLIEHGALKTFKSPKQPTTDEVAKLAAVAQQELAKKVFGSATQQLIKYLQIQNKLGSKLNGKVEKKTAALLNKWLKAVASQPPTKDYEVYGLVMDEKGRRLAGVEVRAFDRDWQRESVLGQAITDAAANYRIAFPASLHKKTKAEKGGPELFVRAYNEQEFLLLQSPTFPNAGSSTEINLTLDNNLRWVSGTVTDEAGRALANLVVRAFDKDLRSEELLGESRTDSKGHYQISYTTAKFKRAEKDSADLRVRVLSNDKKELAVSAVVFNAPERAVIDLTFAAAVLQTASEWESYFAQLNPLLDKLELHELTDEDIDFLTKETEIVREHLDFIRLDALWRNQYKKEKLPASAFYGLLRQGLSAVWENLINSEPERWRGALKQAIADHQVPESIGQELDAFVSKLTKIAVDCSFIEPEIDSKQLPSFGVLLKATQLTSKQQQIIAEIMLGHSLHENPEQLVAQLAQAKVPVAASKTARFAIEAFGLVNQHLPTLAALQTSVAVDFAKGADLAKLNRAQWLEISKNVSKAEQLPKDFSSKEDYANYLADRIEFAFPTAVVGYQLIELNEQVRRDIGQLLIQNPEFDLLSSNVDAFFKTAKLDKIKTKPEILKQQLSKEVRVARLLPTTNRAVHMTNLLDQGFDSAVKISLTSKQAFSKKMESSSSKVVAQQVYSLAKQRAKDLTLQTIRTLDNFDPTIRFIPPLTPSPNSDLADWVQLFGSANGCYCPPCDSVHGPAAYLMDLFEFLKDKDAVAPAGGKNLLDVLFNRRPDLRHLKLNCTNAETPLPYIDLVIELLEQLIIGEPTATSTPQTPEQIEGVINVAASLRALPYTGEAFAVAERAALYASGGALVAPHYPWSLPFDRKFLEAGIYFSLLGASPADVLSLVTLTEELQVELHRSRLNLSPANWNLLHNQAVRDSSSSSIVAESWGLSSLDVLNVLGGDNGLLARSGLSVTEFFSLIESPLMASWHLSITWPEGADHCDIDTARLKESSASGALSVITQVKLFDFIQRLLRLRLALGWSLDRLLQALTALDLSKDQSAFDLIALSRLAFIATELNVSVETFSQALIALQTSPEGSALAIHARAGWLNLLNVSEIEYACLTDLGLADTLATQSAAARLEGLEMFLDNLEQIRAAKIDPAELRYLLRHKDLVPNVFTDDRKLQEQFDALIIAIQNTQMDVPEFPALIPLPDDAGSETRERRRLEEAARADAIAAAKAELASRKMAAALERLRTITGFEFVDQVVTDQTIEGGTVDALLASDETITGARTGGIVQNVIAFSLISSPSDEAIKAASNSLLKITKTTRLLSLLNFTSADISALAKLSRDNTTWFDFNTIPTAESHHLGLKEIEGVLQIALTQAAMPKADIRLLELIADTTSAEDRAISLENISGWSKSLTQNMNPPAAITESLLIQLSRTLGLTDWTLPSTYRQIQMAVSWLQGRRLTLLPNNKLQTLVDAAKSVPTNTDDLRQLARDQFVTESEWFNALTPAMDRLRSAQRDALLAHVLYQDSIASPLDSHGWKTVDDVYAYLLIDVQMGPCQLSSRIVQAHSAVQLFVQRCLMHLEKPEDVALGDVSNIKEWKQWDWMKNYRVWEAGRKVFLYPENWIEPDLRDNKTPFFEELENELLQSEITPESVEQATRNYLTKLHEVARLDIRALYEETVTEIRGDESTADSTIIHMVGRTHAVPHVYFYRKRLEDLSWTAWEKIDLSIDADHLVLVTHNRRPMLFWPQFKEIQVGRSEPPIKNMEIKLSWSLRDHNSWRAPKTGNAVILEKLFDQSDYSFWPRRDPAQLAIMAFKPDPEEDVDARSDFEFLFDNCTDNIGFHSFLNFWSFRYLPPNATPVGNKITYPLGSSLVWSSGPPFENYDYRITATIFSNTFNNSSVLPSQNYPDMREFQPIVVADDKSQFLATQEFLQWYRNFHVIDDDTIYDEGGYFIYNPSNKQYRFTSLYHPYTCSLLNALNEEGLSGIYRSPDTFEEETVYNTSPKRFPRQLAYEDPTVFESRYHPTGIVWRDEKRSGFPYPYEEFDFSFTGAYGNYNWELFFHIPLLIADRLSKSGRYKEAQEWFHCIFDPTDVSPHAAPQKYWRVKPLFLQQQVWDVAPIESLEAMMRRLSEGADDVEQQVAAWRNDPFNPHLLARIRLVAYMKNVVQKYIENLTAWGDSLFRRDTMESINEAIQLYILASEILGPEPKILPPMSRTAKSYGELSSEDSIDSFSNVLVNIENSMPLSPTSATTTERLSPGVTMLYFCIPSNARLLEIRTTISDRLFKIRHCMNIDGKSRQLALFAPPIDPALLVRARAAGLDIGAVLDMAMGSRMKHYRFQPLLQKAFEFCSEVRSFGGALLSALEKQDGELLGQVRARHEVGMLKLTKLMKRQQVDEAETNLEAVQKARLLTEARLEYYSGREFINAAEESQIINLSAAHVLQTTAESFNLAAAVSYAVPDVTIGPFGGSTYGGTYIGNSLKTAGGVLNIIASQFSFAANMSAIVGGYQRRDDDWKFQADLAQKELNQIDQQIIAAEIRLAMAEQDQRNLEQQIEQSQEIETMLREKFTNAQLYSWMSAQLSSMHYQAYQMAFDLAKQAEAAASNEVGLDNNFIQFNNWNGGHKGLLAGEHLAQDLRRLDIAYMQANTRLHEITSNISLRRLNPGALWNLRLSGNTAEFKLYAGLFRLDFPNHTSRKIKSVSISVPGVVGPYGGVNGILKCTQGSEVRSIATSSGQNDAGVFQLDFRDERYLPFEGITLEEESHWTFNLSAEIHPFDYETINDLILHVQYTARESTETTSAATPVSTEQSLDPLEQSLLLSIKHDFPIESRQLRETATPVQIKLTDHLFPYFARSRQVTKIDRLLSTGLETAFTNMSGSPDPEFAVTGADDYFLVRYSVRSAGS